MTDDHDIAEESPPHDAAEPQAGEHAPERRGPRKSSRRFALIACGGAVVVILALVAFLRPSPSETHEDGNGSGSHDESAGEVPGASAAEAGGDHVPVAERPASRPAHGSELALLVKADAAFDAGEFQHARDLYLELLLLAGDFGESGDAIVNWSHGRLALSLARLSRASDAPLIDEPALTFREGSR